MKQKLLQIRILRYAFGVVLAMAVSQGVGWLLSYLVPVLLLGFLAPPALPLSFKEGIKFIAVIGVACYSGLIFDGLVNFPLVFVPMMFLIFMLLFYAKETVIPQLLRTWLLIAIIIIPMMTLTSQNLSVLIAELLFLGAIVTVLIVWIVYAIIPNPKGAEAFIEKKAKQEVELGSETERFKIALESTLVIYPVFLMFFIFQMTDYLVILIYTAILSGMPAFAKNFKVGKFLIVGNLIGGVASIIFYNIMTVVPEFYFMLILIFLCGLVFGTRVMSGKPTGAIFGTAFSTFLLVIGSVFASTDDAAGVVWQRVLFVLIATVYVVLAFGFLNEWKFIVKKNRERKKLLKSLKAESV